MYAKKKKSGKLISLLLALALAVGIVPVASVWAAGDERSVQITDCSHFVGADWAGEAGAYSVGWKYDHFNPEEIIAVKVGAKDAKDRVVLEFTADEAQVAWQRANGYVTSEGLSSAPFWKEYNGTAITEKRDSDWTAQRGAGFDTWQPTLFYVEVKTANATFYDEMAYHYDYPHVHELVHHAAQAPTCTQKGWNAYDTCSDCDYTTYVELAALGHDFGEWETAVSPNCTEKGSEKRTCTHCGFFETRELDELGHDWADDFTVDKEATCTEDGSKFIHCKNCDATKDSTVIPAIGHIDTELRGAKPATCTDEGYTGNKYCKECGELVEKGEVIAKIAHDFHDGKCAVCGAVDPNYEKPENPGESPETGDSNNIALWFSLMGGSIAGLGMALFLRKRRYVTEK